MSVDLFRQRKEEHERGSCVPTTCRWCKLAVLRERENAVLASPAVAVDLGSKLERAFDVAVREVLPKRLWSDEDAMGEAKAQIAAKWLGVKGVSRALREDVVLDGWLIDRTNVVENGPSGPYIILRITPSSRTPIIDVYELRTMFTSMQRDSECVDVVQSGKGSPATIMAVDKRGRGV